MITQYSCKKWPLHGHNCQSYDETCFHKNLKDVNLNKTICNKYIGGFIVIAVILILHSRSHNSCEKKDHTYTLPKLRNSRLNSVLWNFVFNDSQIFKKCIGNSTEISNKQGLVKLPDNTCVKNDRSMTKIVKVTVTWTLQYFEECWFAWTKNSSTISQYQCEK